MKNSLLLFIISGLLLFSCKEEEEPQSLFNNYIVESIVSDIAIDYAGTGTPSTELLSQFKAAMASDFPISLAIVSPEWANLAYYQILFRIPFQDLPDPTRGTGISSAGRRIDFSDETNIRLFFSLAPDFEEPNQLHKTIVVEDIQFRPGLDEIEVVFDQTLFDQTKKDWVTGKLTYLFKKGELEIKL